jgi:hypothetical protein
MFLHVRMPRKVEKYTWHKVGSVSVLRSSDVSMLEGFLLLFNYEIRGYGDDT